MDVLNGKSFSKRIQTLQKFAFAGRERLANFISLLYASHCPLNQTGLGVGLCGLGQFQSC